MSSRPETLKKDEAGRSRYRQESDEYCIDIYINNILQLFDGRDPAPFRQKDLDEDFVDYLMLSMRELNSKDVKLVIHLDPKSSADVDLREVISAIHNYFSFEVESHQGRLSLLFEQGRTALAMGIAFLLVCQIFIQFVPTGHGAISTVLHEGLSIIGWVALWRPINIMLYEWWPYRDRIRLLELLSKIKVEIRKVQ